MPLESLNHLLKSVQNREEWRKQQQFRRILACWSETVGSTVAAQSYPTSYRGQVLHVAVSSSVWAQTLMFERYRILEKLNARLPFALKDIRFSTAYWQQNPVEPNALAEDHPSYIHYRSTLLTRGTPLRPQDPKTAFQNWAKVMQERSKHLPRCPVCHCPTPTGEIERWSVCSICAARRFH